MKCSKCGFISNRDFYRCPYCGHTNEEDFEGIRTRVNLGHNFSAQIRTIVIISVINLFLFSVLLDWFLDFKYAISLWSYFILFGSLTVLDVTSSKRSSLITSLEKMDLFLLGYLLLACGLCAITGVFDAREYFPALIIPFYLILTAVVSTFVVFMRKSKMRPIFTEVVFILHFIIATILFVFLLVNKYSMNAELARAAKVVGDEPNIKRIPFQFLLLGTDFKHETPLFKISEISIFVAFGASLIYLVNYNIVLAGSIFRKVKRIYGGERD